VPGHWDSWTCSTPKTLVRSDSFPVNDDPARLANLFGIGHIELDLDLRSHVFGHAKDNRADWRSRILRVRHEVAVEQGVELYGVKECFWLNSGLSGTR